ncbi:His Kinase A (phospho-acceptor) domain-containing protein [Clostridium cavendishii DSM 21758]|uniref:histidine kinase n=1 Tax=Clostridium cavendishii DSM 21758 TaxID=1121302 RepID=A0A1M6LTC3_9CLOT|nr:HAMP domain-containing sensor histidine kinase [Clostridium cavendishii]SHJ74322.1 His Kinase A (phospho-acceptor) domain-containing protein [Clostridium cavendishii DSM 21758]
MKFDIKYKFKNALIIIINTLFCCFLYLMIKDYFDKVITGIVIMIVNAMLSILLTINVINKAAINAEKLKEEAKDVEKYITENKNLEEHDRLKNEFLSLVSHELRTPLTAILGFTKIIKKRMSRTIIPFINDIAETYEIDDENIKKVNRNNKKILENINIMISEGDRLTVMINNLLDITKLEAGTLDWNFSIIDIKNIINKSILATYSLIEEKEIEILDDIEGDIPNIIADGDKILQVLINIISNAIKFTDEGTITISAKQTKNQKIIISVSDTGLGIEEQYYKTIFDRFKQIDNAINKSKGTGLGLWICKSIIEKHNGEIWVESEFGKGSIFSFTIPMKNDIEGDFI